LGNASHSVDYILQQLFAERKKKGKQNPRISGYIRAKHKLCCVIHQEKAMPNWFTMVFVTVLTAGMAHGQAQITVTGEASVFAAPDMATVSLGVTTQQDTAGAAMAANSVALNAVMVQLTGAGVAARDLQTSQLQLNPIWTDYGPTTPPSITGYAASNLLNVRVHDLTQIGAILDAAIADGANTLNGIEFAHSDARPSLDSARKAAIADAIARAKVLTQAAGVALGPIVTISEVSDMGAAPPMMKSMALEDAAMPIAGGEIGVTARVVMVFELAQ
jgi:uncharacterized protein